MKIKQWILFFYLICSLVNPFLFACMGDFESTYHSLSNFYHPSLSDYRLIQYQLAHAPRKELELMGDSHYISIARNFKIIGRTFAQIPQNGIINVNSSLNEIENCIIMYASFNKNFPRGLKNFVSLIEKSDFKGHILFRIGGWPDTEGGSLALAHVPYAFKPCFFKEAQRLGYKRVLWLDTSIIPLVSLNEIFAMIAEKGYFAAGNFHQVGPYINAQAAAAVGLTVEQTHSIPSCSAGLIGVDFSNETSVEIIDWWYRLARDTDSFYCPRADQSMLSLVLYLLGCRDLVDFSRLPHSRAEINSDSLFLVDKNFVHY